MRRHMHFCAINLYALLWLSLHLQKLIHKHVHWMMTANFSNEVDHKGFIIWVVVNSLSRASICPSSGEELSKKTAINVR